MVTAHSTSRPNLSTLAMLAALCLVGSPVPAMGAEPELEAAILKATPGYTPDSVEILGGEARYVAERADLNADGRDEVLVYLLGPHFCGTGGCTMLLMTPYEEAYRLVTSFPTTSLPLVVAPSTTSGWSDLLKRESGGGAPPSWVRYTFDGSVYREQERLPAEPVPSGVQLLAGEVSFADGTILSPAQPVASSTVGDPTGGVRGLILASDSWPPFTGTEDTQRVAIDLVERALDRAGYRATPTIVDWKAVERGLADGTYDGSAALWRTPEREEILLFSDPYLENRLVLVGRRGDQVDEVDIGDLGGVRVAVVANYAYGDALSRASGVLFVGTESDQESLSTLMDGEVEYILIDDLVARYLIQNQPDEVAANLEIARRPLSRKTLHFALRRDLPRAEEIILAFNAAIQEMLQDGTYAEALGMGWVRIDVDGDGLDEMVTLAEAVGSAPPGTVYDVFGDEPDIPPEKQRFIIGGTVFEGWAAIPNDIKAQGPASPMEPRMKQGVTVFTLKF